MRIKRITQFNQEGNASALLTVRKMCLWIWPVPVDHMVELKPKLKTRNVSRHRQKSGEAAEHERSTNRSWSTGNNIDKPSEKTVRTSNRREHRECLSDGKTKNHSNTEESSEVLKRSALYGCPVFAHQ